VQQILQSAPVVQAALNLRHKLFRHVDRNATPVRATVEHINFDAVRQTGTPGNSCGCTGYDEGSANPEAQARDSSIRFAASAQHPKAIPNQQASYEECDTMHMYGARKTCAKIAR
jgi:hypothetical protein